MDRTVAIPIRVRQAAPTQSGVNREESSAPQASHEEMDEATLKAGAPSQGEMTGPRAPEQGIPGADLEADQEAAEWRERALRLQADMANFRRRQQRLAEDQIDAERRRLLSAFLRVVDDLERALAAPAGDDRALRQGVEVTHRAALHMLKKEGVERFRAKNERFDPARHEAVATVDGNGTNAAVGKVFQVIEPGYLLNDELLRPAKVVVAV